MSRHNPATPTSASSVAASPANASVRSASPATAQIRRAAADDRDARRDLRGAGSPPRIAVRVASS